MRPAQSQPARLNELELTGRSRTHVTDVADLSCVLHREVIPSFLAIREAARCEGIDLQAASSFRDFDRQVAIWNEKYRGERPLLDRTGRALNATELSPEERVEAILLWSALPGASRHHWGTDLDVFDAAAMPDRSRLRLISEEYTCTGPFARLTAWLDTHMYRFGFFRPYADPGDGTIPRGVSPEPWHLSFAPLSTHFLNQLTSIVLSRAIESSSIEGREILMTRIDELYQRFIAHVVTAPAASLAMELSDHRRMV